MNCIFNKLFIEVLVNLLVLSENPPDLTKPEKLNLFNIKYLTPLSNSFLGIVFFSLSYNFLLLGFFFLIIFISLTILNK